jgi:hypothetical protein
MAEKGGQSGIRIDNGALPDKRDSRRRVVEEELSEKELIALTGAHIEPVEGPGKHLRQSFEDFVARGFEGGNGAGVKGQDRVGGASAIERKKGSLATAHRLECLPPFILPRLPKPACEIGDKEGPPGPESLSFKEKSPGRGSMGKATKRLTERFFSRQCLKTEVTTGLRTNNPDMGKAPRFF